MEFLKQIFGDKALTYSDLEAALKIALTDSHQILADVADTADRLEYIIRENQQNNR